MFGLIKKVFFILLKIILSASNHAKCVSFSYQKCMTQPTLINLHPNEYSQELCYYPFVVTVSRCTESYNTVNDLSIRVFVSN